MYISVDQSGGVSLKNFSKAIWGNLAGWAVFGVTQTCVFLRSWLIV